MFVIAGEIEIDPANHDTRGPGRAPDDGGDAPRRRAASATCSRATSPGAAASRSSRNGNRQQALDAHFASPHMAAFQAAVGGLGVKRMALQRYEVSSVGPLR